VPVDDATGCSFIGGGARNAGIPVVVVNYGYTVNPAEELGADAVISDMRELVAIFPIFWKTV
jgi:phosphoglycolate phosphatase-like HAD superfamily hydrolase